MNKSTSFLKANYSSLFKSCFSIFCLCCLSSVTGFAQVKPKPAAKAVSGSFVMCEVLPGPEVASKAPFTIPFSSMEAWPTAGTKAGCRYVFKSADDQAFITIGLTDLGTAKNALASYQNAWQASKDLWEETPENAIVLQDTGFFSGKDECGIKMHLGQYVLDINFKGQFPDVSAEQKKASGIVLAEMVMRRLQYLWPLKGKE